MATKQLKSKYLIEACKQTEEFKYLIENDKKVEEFNQDPPSPEIVKDFCKPQVASRWPPPIELLSPPGNTSPPAHIPGDVSPTPSNMSMWCQRDSPPIKEEIPSPTPSVLELGGSDSDPDLPEEPYPKRRCSSPQNYTFERRQLLPAMPTGSPHQFRPLHNGMVSVPSHPIFPVVAVIAVPGYMPHNAAMVPPPIPQHPHMMPSLPQHPAPILLIRPEPQLPARMPQGVGVHPNMSITHGMAPYNSRMPQYTPRMAIQNASNGLASIPRMPITNGISINATDPYRGETQPNQNIPHGNPSNPPLLQPVPGPICLKNPSQEQVHRPVISHPPNTTSLGFPERPMHTVVELERNEKYSLQKIHPAENPLPALELTAAKYECSTCHRVFPSYRSREEHVQDMHNQYECGTCHIMFPNHGSREEHIEDMHPPEPPILNLNRDQHNPDDQDKNSDTSGVSQNGEERLGKDERKAREMGIDLHISVWDIVMQPMDEFNERLATSEMTDEQINECRDIRRRGKNKVAAQNCRKRKNGEIDDMSKKKAELSGYLSRRSKVLTELNQSLLHWKTLFSELEVDILDQQELNKLVFKIIDENGKIRFAKRETSEMDIVRGKCHTDGNLILNTSDPSVQTVIRRQQQNSTPSMAKRRMPIEEPGKRYKLPDPAIEVPHKQYRLPGPKTEEPSRQYTLPGQVIEATCKQFRLPGRATLSKVPISFQPDHLETFHPANTKSDEISTVTWSRGLKPAPASSVIRLSSNGYSQPGQQFHNRRDLHISTPNGQIKRMIPPGISATQVTDPENIKAFKPFHPKRNIDSMDTHISKYNNQVHIDTLDLRTFRKPSVRKPIIVSKPNISNTSEKNYPQSTIAAKHTGLVDQLNSPANMPIRPVKSSGLSPGINELSIQASNPLATLPCTPQYNNSESSEHKEHQGNGQTIRAFI